MTDVGCRRLAHFLLATYTCINLLMMNNAFLKASIVANRPSARIFERCVAFRDNVNDKPDPSAPTSFPSNIHFQTDASFAVTQPPPHHRRLSTHCQPWDKAKAPEAALEEEPVRLPRPL